MRMPEALISDPVYSERSVSRMTLRQVLLTGMEDVVHFDHVFDRYEVGALRCTCTVLFPLVNLQPAWSGPLQDVHMIKAQVVY
jgi:hypothetical protein